MWCGGSSVFPVWGAICSLSPYSTWGRDECSKRGLWSEYFLFKDSVVRSLHWKVVQTLSFFYCNFFFFLVLCTKDIRTSHPHKLKWFYRHICFEFLITDHLHHYFIKLDINIKLCSQLHNHLPVPSVDSPHPDTCKITPHKLHFRLHIDSSKPYPE